MINLIVFGLIGATLCGVVFWLASNTNRINRERRAAPKRLQQARQAELRRKLKLSREASKTIRS